MTVTKVNRDLFYKLASDLPEERVQTAVLLIKEVSELALPECNDEWSYVVNRLIKGLASDRNSARLGFSLCLTEIINLSMEMDEGKRPDCLKSIKDYLHLLSETLTIDANDNKKKKGKEERSLLFGKLFGLQALLSEPVFSKIFLDGKKHISEFANIFMNELTDLASRKNWIREPSLFTFFETVQKLLPFNHDNKFVIDVCDLLDKQNLTLTNEGLAVYLMFNKETDFNSQNLSLSNKGWKSNNPLIKGNLPLLSEVLRNSSSQMEENSKSANWNPRLHFVWNILLPFLLNVDNVEEEKPPKKKAKNANGTATATASYIQFPEFWKMVVDESFFNEKASSERKYLGFLIFNTAFELIPSKYINECFSQNFMRSLVNQSNDPKRLLHKISQKTLAVILKRCEEEPDQVLIPTVNALLFGRYGSINFDKLCKTKLSQKLIAVKDLSSGTLSELIQLFTSNIDTSEENIVQTRFCLDSILHIIRGHKMEIDNPSDLAHSLLHPIIKLAFFTKDNEILNEVAKERLYSILSELKAVSSGHSWQYHTLHELIALEESNVLVNQLDESLLQTKMSGLKVLNLLTESVDSDVALRGLESLLSMCLLQLYAGDDESVSIIDELCEYHNDTSKEKSLVGITEILLSLLAQKKAVLKSLSLTVWEQFIEQVGKEELSVLLDVLPARENKQGFAQLFEGAEEYEEDNGENSENDSSSENNGEDDKEEMNDDESEESENDTESSSEEEEDDANVNAIDREATSALAKALNLPDNIVTSNGEVNFNELDDFSGDEGENESEEEESMDDEKMMELDEQLSAIFKRRKDALSTVPTGNKRKIEAKESRENVIAFKHRIIDMLAVYVKYATSIQESEVINYQKIENLLLFIDPMIRCIKETLDRSLAEKIAKLLKTRIFKVRPSSFKIEDHVEIFKHLTSLQERLLTSKPGQHNSIYFSVCSTSSIFISKILLENYEDKEAAYDQLIDVYSNTAKEWMKRGKFTTTVFIDFFNWLSSKRQTTQ